MTIQFLLPLLCIFSIARGVADLMDLQKAWDMKFAPFRWHSFLNEDTQRPNHNSRSLELFDKALGPENYTRIINYLPFYGDWLNNNASSKTFNFFDYDSGFTSVGSSTTDGFVDKKMWDVDYTFFDGRYQDQKYLKVRIRQSYDTLSFNQQNATFSGNQISLDVNFGKNRRPLISKTCLVNFQVSFIDLDTMGPFITLDGKDSGDIGIWVSFESQECEFSLSSRILKISDTNTKELFIYIALMIISAGIGVLSSNALVKSFPEDLNSLAKISLWSIWLINAWDFYLFLSHVALSVGMSGWLMIVALAFFSLSIMSETKLVYAIYVSSYYSQLEANVSNGCKFFAIYYGLLYFLVFSYTFFTSWIWVLLTSSFYLVPQILLVYKRGKKYRFNFLHILGLSVSRISFVLYIKTYPLNIFRLSPDGEFTSIYFGIIFFQVLILFLQRFLPKFCLTPTPYKYFVKVTENEEKEELCPICMEALKDQSQFGESNKKPLLEKNDKPLMVMQTPCRHRYHENCLRLWMKNKLECPSCRYALPSLNNEDI